MFEKKKVLVNLILDKSGSMSHLREKTVSSVNEYISSLRKQEGIDYHLTLTMFDTQVTTPIVDKPLKDLSDLKYEEYNPDGGTALYDAVCTTIKKVVLGNADKAICVIMTDGEENSSREYTEKQMASLIDERTKEGNWTFVYLGANQDSFAKAQQFHIPSFNVSNFNATVNGMGATMRTMASNTAAYAMSASGNTANFFSEKDQQDLEGTK